MPTNSSSATPTRRIFAAVYDHYEFLRLLQSEERRSTELFVTHYRSRYRAEAQLPILMATELLSFGALSKMHSSVRTSVRKKIAREFSQPHEIFANWLHTLTAIRNLCAHHNRLWNRELAVKPKMSQEWKDSGLDNSRFYVIAVMLQSLLSAIAPNHTWKEDLERHLISHPWIDLNAMRFPLNWQAVAPWVASASARP